MYNVFEMYQPTVKNFEQLVKLAIDNDVDLKIMLVEYQREKFLTVNFLFNIEESDDHQLIWAEDAGECASRLGKGEYPEEINLLHEFVIGE